MAPNLDESGVAHCMIKVAVKKVALPHGFVPMPSAFYFFVHRSPTIQYHLGRSLRDRPSSTYFSATQDNRDQALRKTYNENFLSSLGMFLASPPHVSKNKEPKTTLSHSKLARPQITSMFPTHIQRCIAAKSCEKGCGLDAEPILDDPCMSIFVAAFCMVLSSCGTMSVQVLHHALQKKGLKREGIVKIWCLN